jgi:hypothetical protein
MTESRGQKGNTYMRPIFINEQSLPNHSTFVIPFDIKTPPYKKVEYLQNLLSLKEVVKESSHKDNIGWDAIPFVAGIICSLP